MVDEDGKGTILLLLLHNNTRLIIIIIIGNLDFMTDALFFQKTKIICIRNPRSRFIFLVCFTSCVKKKPTWNDLQNIFWFINSLKKKTKDTLTKQSFEGYDCSFIEAIIASNDVHSVLTLMKQKQHKNKRNYY